MRALGILVAGAMCYGAASASAAPFGGQSLSATDVPLVQIHHKPGHKGGPPWARKGNRNTRGYATRIIERREVCRTTLRTYYDDYTGEYIRRSVRVCD